ncbi:MAG: GAF domain-containing protein [Candidatus Tectomicrobia bacterium]|uniref:GAF domain-containing protein n=1 Tax=Tectimicrobiota bacterium TaxID=2528274 RepID=A0A932MNB0_UNCTE|nr:GAF domain-containing protein [Candidatus Tectomicrobia bacterium]
MKAPDDGNGKGPEGGPLQDLIQLGTRLLKARYGALALLSGRGEGFDQFITAGIPEETRRAIGALPQGRGLLGVPIRDPRPLRVRNIARDPRSAGLPKNAPPMRSFLGVPIFSNRKVQGGLYFTEKTTAPEFRPADERLAESLARVAVEPRPRMRRSLDILRQAAGGTGAAVITSQAREIIFWSDEARQLYGYTEDEVLGRSFVDIIVPPEERAAWRRVNQPRLTRELQEGKVVKLEAQRLRKDDTRITVIVTVTPIRHDVAGITALTSVHIIQKI